MHLNLMVFGTPLNFGEYKPIESQWISLYVNGDDVNYFDSYGDKYIPKEIKKFVHNKNIKTSIYRIPVNDSIKGTSKGKSLLDYTNLFSPKKYEKNDKMKVKLKM